MAPEPLLLFLKFLFVNKDKRSDGDIRKNDFMQNGGVDKSYVDYVRVYENVL